MQILFRRYTNQKKSRKKQVENFISKIFALIKYVSNIKPDGWLLVKLEDEKIHPLPYQLKLEVYKVENNREYFTILESSPLFRVIINILSFLSIKSKTSA